MFPHHHKNHDRRTEDSCYRADAQFRRGKDRPRQPVAEQAEHASAQETARNQHQRSCIGKQPADQMRNRDSNKGNRTGKCRYAADKMLDKITIKKRRCATLTPMLFAYVSPIWYAPIGLDNRNTAAAETKVTPAMTATFPRSYQKTSARPVMQVDNIRIAGEGHNKIRDCRANYSRSSRPRRSALPSVPFSARPGAQTA